MWGISWLAAEPVSFSRRTLLHGVSKSMGVKLGLSKNVWVCLKTVRCEHYLGLKASDKRIENMAHWVITNFYTFYLTGQGDLVGLSGPRRLDLQAVPKRNNPEQRRSHNKHFVFNNFFFQKIGPFMRYCGKSCCRSQATDGNITRRMRFACWITEVRDTSSVYVINIIVFPGP